MNRHERRKQKKEKGNISALQNELLKAIQLHVNKDFRNAELLYQQIIAKEPEISPDVSSIHSSQIPANAKVFLPLVG